VGHAALLGRRSCAGTGPAGKRGWATIGGRIHLMAIAQPGLDQIDQVDHVPWGTTLSAR